MVLPGDHKYALYPGPAGAIHRIDATGVDKSFLDPSARMSLERNTTAQTFLHGPAAAALRLTLEVQEGTVHLT